MRTEPLKHRQLRTREDGGLVERHVWVEWLTGPRAGRRDPIEGPTTIGSSSDAELCLEEPTLSRLHVELAPHRDGLQVTDLGSTNGTYVAGVRVSVAVLEHDAALVLGRVRARVGVEEVSVGGTRSRFGALATQSPSMQRLLGQASAVAAVDVPVLVSGEPGTGKELFARELHRASARAPAPFVVVDCRALSPTLVDSELFGHVRGAFTGAAADRAGLFEQAAGGTVLLDEVGELPLEVQPRLLRLLEGGALKRVGGVSERPFTARVVATTCHRLEERVAEGLFRQDLFFRLAVVQLALPALRERAQDVPALVQAFSAERGHPEAQWPEPVLQALAARRWPGNVRQLRALVERCFATGPAPERLEVSQLEALLEERSGGDAEKRRVVGALERHGGNQTLAAQELGMARGTLLSRMEAFGLARPRKRAGSRAGPREPG